MNDNRHVKAVSIDLGKRIGLRRGFQGGRFCEREDEAGLATMVTTTKTVATTGVVGPVEEDTSDSCEDSGDDGQRGVDPWRTVCRHWGLIGVVGGVGFSWESWGGRWDPSGK